MQEFRYEAYETGAIKKRHEHRTIGVFLAHEAWTQNVDCLVLKRQVLKNLLGVNRYIRPSRLWLFLEAIAPWFPHHTVLYYGRRHGIASVYVSRRPIKNFLLPGRMQCEERIQTLKRGHPRTTIFTLENRWTRRTIEGYLAGVASGIDNTRKEFISIAAKEAKEATARPKNLPFYAQSTAPEWLVECYCSCSGRWGKLNKPNPGITIIRYAAPGEFIATCLKCGKETHENYRWGRRTHGKRDISACRWLVGIPAE